MPMEVQPTVAPYVADKLHADQARIFNMVLSLLGVDNTNTEKRERMLTNEIESNDEEIMLMRRSRLFNRKQFCDAVNKRFGLSIDVRYWAGESDSFDDNEADAQEMQIEKSNLGVQYEGEIDDHTDDNDNGRQD